MSSQASHLEPKYVTDPATNIQYHQDEVKNIFWNESFAMDLKEAQSRPLYVNLVKNYSKETESSNEARERLGGASKMEIVAFSEAIDVSQFKSENITNAQVTIYDNETKERMGHLFFQIGLMAETEMDETAHLKKYDMNLKMYTDEEGDGFNASLVSVPQTVSSLRRDDRSQSLLSQS